MTAHRPTTLEWFGTATFRVQVAGLHLFFDAYLDRLPGLDPVGLSTAEVERADFVFISHAHFDHLYGADALARRTGATVVCSPESAWQLRGAGFPEDQLLVVTGGETVRCGPDTTVRVLPSLHSCLYAHGERDSGIECLGDLGISAQDRARKVAEFFALIDSLDDDLGVALRHVGEHTSAHDGGQLAFHLVSSEGSALVSGSAGCWRGILADLRPDVAILSASGRPNVDGEPFQGSMAQFLVAQVELLCPRRVVFCHHDPLIPGVDWTDVGAAAAALREQTSYAPRLELGYAEARPLFA
jgi:L-ascorbate metabolism protein UlaG (beta-lactamase superfamily)